MRHVAQLDKNGCGVACVAMLVGITYRESRRLMFGSETPSRTYTATLRNALRHHRIRTASRLVPLRTRSHEALRHDAILKVNVARDGDRWHWIVWDAARHKLLDPLKRSKWKPKRVRAVSFLKVQRPN